MPACYRRRPRRLRTLRAPDPALLWRPPQGTAGTTQDYEKLGLSYLGRPLGEDGAPLQAPLLYDARDLVTRALCQESEAARAGRTPDEHAAATAEL